MSSALALLAFLAQTFRAEPVPKPLLAKMRTSTWHEGCPMAPESLSLLKLEYLDYEGKPQQGQLIVDAALAAEVTSLFRELFRMQFSIARMEPIENFEGDDLRSMDANNTSAFNCRDVTGQKGKFSNHSWGRAIDINPLTNPYVKGSRVLPEGGRAFLDRSIARQGAILTDGSVVHLFEQHGWRWGGRWEDRKDYQHFEKKP